jgi:hypothetical protein
LGFRRAIQNKAEAAARVVLKNEDDALFEKAAEHPGRG